MRSLEEVIIVIYTTSKPAPRRRNGKARLDFGIMRDGTGSVWIGRDGDFPDAIITLLHGVRDPVPVV
jgi:hypothetical protein